MKLPILAAALIAGLCLSSHGLASEAARPRTLAADTPSVTAHGNTFMAPKDWSFQTRGPAVLLTAPEGNALVALVDLEATDADAAVKAAWDATGLEKRWPLKVATDRPARDGWEKIRSYEYETSTNDRRVVFANAAWAGGRWSVSLVDADQAVWDKRGAQVTLIFDRFLPKGYQRESFAGRPALKLDAARIEALKRFVADAQRELGVPGVAMGLVQDGRVVYAGGQGVRELGKPEPVDADTLFLVGSNTKSMTTLMLARLVDAGEFDWTTPVTKVLPGFALGDAATTARVQVQHLVCACTGLPRQDREWLMEFEHATAESTLRTLATMQPTSEFGALYQYSNPLASAAGYVGAHVAYPDLELGAAYDRAMQELVFAPLGMRSTTFDFERALDGNHASPHGWDLQARVALGYMKINYAVVPVRPAGGAWSNVNDMLRYVQMELDEGVLADGSRYMSKEALLERRKQKVPVGNDASYGMGLETDRTWGVPVVHHGGSLRGYKTEMFWLPEHDVGAVILTNSDAGGAMLGAFHRRLLEVLFDGKANAAERITSTAKDWRAWYAAEDERLVSPPAPAVLSALAPRYRNAALGDVAIRDEAGATMLDFGEWASAAATRRNDDGTDALVTITPGLEGVELLIDNQGPVRRLVLRDRQRDYVFEEVTGAPMGAGK